jgi:hypothetical protein
MSGTTRAACGLLGAMPRYYFHSDDGRTAYEDDEGIEQACLQAQAAIADLPRDVVPNDGLERTMKVTVRDERGRVVVRAAFKLAVLVALDPSAGLSQHTPHGPH